MEPMALLHEAPARAAAAVVEAPQATLDTAVMVAVLAAAAAVVVPAQTTLATLVQAATAEADMP